MYKMVIRGQKYDTVCRDLAMHASDLISILSIPCIPPRVIPECRDRSIPWTSSDEAQQYINTAKWW